MATQKPIYHQCYMVKDEGPLRPRKFTTSFLPAKFAKVGLTVKLRGEDGWVVHKVGDPVEGRPNYRKMIKGHRKNTGDDTPKVLEEE